MARLAWGDVLLFVYGVWALFILFIVVLAGYPLVFVWLCLACLSIFACLVSICWLAYLFVCLCVWLTAYLIPLLAGSMCPLVCFFVLFVCSLYLFIQSAYLFCFLV